MKSTHHALKSWMVIWCIGWCIMTPQVHAATGIAVKVVASQHDPGGVYLRQYLRDRGFTLADKKGSRQLLVLALPGPKTLQLRYQRHSRTFRLPQGLKALHTRARAIVSMVEMFLEEARSKPTKASQPSPSRRKRATVRKPLRRRSVRSSRRAPALRKIPPRRKATLRRRSLAAKTQPVVGASSRTLARAKTKRAVVARAGTPGAVPKARPRPSPPRPKTKATTNIAALTKRPAPRQKPAARRKATPKPKRVARSASAEARLASPWAPKKALSWSVGLSGSARWGGHIHASWGGALMVGMRWKGLALRLDASLLTFWLQQQRQLIPIVRPGLWAGWRIPLERWTTRWEVYVLGGVILDPFVIEQVKGARAIWHVGLAVAAEGHWRITPRVSLFLRYSFSGYLIGYEPDAEGLDRKAYPAPTQNAMQMGVQLRF